jgi:nuclear RNA export factor
LKRLKNERKIEKSTRLLRVGPAEIMKCFNALPKTKHPLDEPPEKKKFLVESVTIQGGPTISILIMIHGEFTDIERKSKRSFDRSFVIVPALPGSRAAMAGIPYSVLNDQLVLRCFHGNSEWINADSITSPTAGLNAMQLKMVDAFQKATGLNYNFTLQCLTETGWDLQKANEVFMAAKHQLPPHAFTS